ncbi:MAG: cation:proton antiporter [Saprospiraceae bacterium]|nr:cation:proton antiporter [Saprospiraceae bacterium]
MLYSFAELIIICLLAAWLFKKIKIPELVGILAIGVILGPYVLGLIDPQLLGISSELRLAALVVILLRAGFELKKDTLNKVGKTALLLSFIPAIFEIITITFLAPSFLGISYLEAAILGTILGAVSPAVVVPMMIDFIEKRKGTKKGIPTLMLAASSIDDVFVIVIYSILIGIYTGSHVNLAWKLAGIPISIILGILVGIALGLALIKLFDKFNPRATKRVLIIMAVSILLLKVEHLIEHWIPFAALVSLMSIGFIILEKREKYSHEISLKLAKIWVIAEIILFSMVGAEVDISVAFHSGLIGALLIFLGLIARSIGTYICVLKAGFNFKEKMFMVIAYLPKATVQAAIGAAPLAAMKLNGMPTYPGEIILAVAVLSIVLTAPLGAWAISFTGKRWLEEERSRQIRT